MYTATSPSVEGRRKGASSGSGSVTLSDSTHLSSVVGHGGVEGRQRLSERAGIYEVGMLHTSPAARELYVRGLLRRPESLEHCLAVGAEAVREEEAQSEAERGADAGVGADLPGGLVEGQAVRFEETWEDPS